jgi:citrate lyase subunit beta/citryl-CoA lyase
MAARAAGVQAVDTVHIDVHDLDGLEHDLALARELGFDGMLVLHPKELDLVHRHLSPSPAEVAEACEMIRLFEEAKLENRGVAILNGKFIGPPMVRAAQKTLARHDIITRKAGPRR